VSHFQGLYVTLSVSVTVCGYVCVSLCVYTVSLEEGKPNETGIEECAKVANWQEKGGAPKTPTD